jgi:hypothetical protein
MDGRTFWAESDLEHACWKYALTVFMDFSFTENQPAGTAHRRSKQFSASGAAGLPVENLT